MKFVDPATDPWLAATEAEATASAAEPTRRLLSLAQWQAARATWPVDVAAGIFLANDADVEAIGGDVARFAVIALHFPKWTDGRAYSQAHLLRARLRFAGEIRATGDVLVDMMPLLARSGFDAVAMRADQSRAVAERALSFFPRGYYQGDTLQPRPRFARDSANGAQSGASQASGGSQEAPVTSDASVA